jgi:hypothetical protein
VQGDHNQYQKTFGRFIAWVICIVFKIIMKTLCILVFIMKSFGAVSTYIPIISLITLTSSTYLLGCKFCHVPPHCIIDYNGRIYCVVHRL